MGEEVSVYSSVAANVAWSKVADVLERDWQIDGRLRKLLSADLSVSVLHITHRDTSR